MTKWAGWARNGRDLIAVLLQSANGRSLFTRAPPCSVLGPEWFLCADDYLARFLYATVPAEDIIVRGGFTYFRHPPAGMEVVIAVALDKSPDPLAGLKHGTVPFMWWQYGRAFEHHFRELLANPDTVEAEFAVLMLRKGE